MGENYLKNSAEYTTKIRTDLDEFWTGTQLQTTLTFMRNAILSNNHTGPSVIMGEWWIGNITLYINILKKIQDSLARDIARSLDDETNKATEYLVVMVVVLLIIMIITPLVIILIYKMMSNVQTFARSLHKKREELSREKQRTDYLLHQILPVSVAQKLRNRESVEPESFEQVTILFR